ncbi:hypothetical protein OG906_40385 (plasmid) [Streptomyces sp. NBC_01426]|uniref:hypothetical protein n=1 Tax=Streptomyces sp. NBC_01426 TaxID=2975866 RepID=UPI002E341C80|nr:hypothetical protein [Streptomyces sp. NBC_01426]
MDIAHREALLNTDPVPPADDPAETGRGEWIRSGQYRDAEPGVTRYALIEPVASAQGAERLAQPAVDWAAIVWDRQSAGSGPLNDWRTDAQLIVDIEPAGDDMVKLTARVRGVAVTRADNGSMWERAEEYRASGELILQARDRNGEFTMVVVERCRGRVENAGPDPAEPCVLTHNLPRAQLKNHAVDFSYHVGSYYGVGSLLSRATVSGRCVLTTPTPPPMARYRAGAVRAPAGGEVPLCAGQPDTGPDSPGGSSPWQ